MQHGCITYTCATTMSSSQGNHCFVAHDTGIDCEIKGVAAAANEKKQSGSLCLMKVVALVKGLRGHGTDIVAFET